jgi:hypothetical protein
VSRAYAYARICARKSQLLGKRDAALLLAAPDALALLGGDPFEKLMRLYALAIRTYRAPIFRALLALHEIENVKLLWRVVANDRDRGAIARLWLPLGALATVPMPRDVLSPRDLVDQLAKAPYGAIAKSVLLSGAGEAAFDRWARQRLLDEAKRLPKSEALTRQMIESWGRTLCAPTGRGAQRAPEVRRAFVGNPFLLAPAVAVVLLAEAEVRGVRAIVERGGDESLDDVTMRVLAGSQMGG